MSLENTFRKVKKPSEEKKLEVISSDESILDELRVYFEKNKYEGFRDWDKSGEYFVSCMNFLKRFELNPEIITEFNTRTKDRNEWESFGFYLSAMIQTSYEQENNNFEFGDVYAHGFGAFLQGQPQNPIKITTKSIGGHFSLWKAKNCTLTAETIEGYKNLEYITNCSIKTETLKENHSLRYANGCLVEITNYQGEDFGHYMKNCTIKSRNKKTLEILKKQTEGVNNKFKLKK